jgi:DNA-binding response OmpR family regulator
VGKRILVVDDDEQVLKLEYSILDGAGYEVALAGDGREALQILGGEPGFDLVILDVIMPGMDGYAVCREIRARPELEGVPVVFLTGKPGTEGMIEGLDAGAALYVSKPFTASKLLAVVENVLESAAVSEPGS